MKSKLLFFFLTAGLIIGAFSVVHAQIVSVAQFRDVVITQYNVPLLSPVPCSVAYRVVGKDQIVKSTPPALTAQAISDIGGDSTQELCASLRTAFTSGSVVTLGLGAGDKIISTSLKIDTL